MMHGPMYDDGYISRKMASLQSPTSFLPPVGHRPPPPPPAYMAPGYPPMGPPRITPRISPYFDYDYGGYGGYGGYPGYGGYGGYGYGGYPAMPPAPRLSRYDHYLDDSEVDYQPRFRPSMYSPAVASAVADLSPPADDTHEYAARRGPGRRAALEEDEGVALRRPSPLRRRPQSQLPTCIGESEGDRHMARMQARYPSLSEPQALQDHVDKMRIRLKALAYSLDPSGPVPEIVIPERASRRGELTDTAKKYIVPALEYKETPSLSTRRPHYYPEDEHMKDNLRIKCLSQYKSTRTAAGYYKPKLYAPVMPDSYTSKYSSKYTAPKWEEPGTVYGASSDKKPYSKSITDGSETGTVAEPDVVEEKKEKRKKKKSREPEEDAVTDGAAEGGDGEAAAPVEEEVLDEKEKKKLEKKRRKAEREAAAKAAMEAELEALAAAEAELALLEAGSAKPADAEAAPAAAEPAANAAESESAPPAKCESPVQEVEECLQPPQPSSPTPQQEYQEQQDLAAPEQGEPACDAAPPPAEEPLAQAQTDLGGTDMKESAPSAPAPYQSLESFKPTAAAASLEQAQPDDNFPCLSDETDAMIVGVAAADDTTTITTTTTVAAATAVTAAAADNTNTEIMDTLATPPNETPKVDQFESAAVIPESPSVPSDSMEPFEQYSSAKAAQVAEGEQDNTEQAYVVEVIDNNAQNGTAKPEEEMVLDDAEITGAWNIAGEQE